MFALGIKMQLPTAFAFPNNMTCSVVFSEGLGKRKREISITLFLPPFTRVMETYQIKDRKRAGKAQRGHMSVKGSGVSCWYFQVTLSCSCSHIVTEPQFQPVPVAVPVQTLVISKNERKIKIDSTGTWSQNKLEQCTFVHTESLYCSLRWQLILNVDERTPTQVFSWRCRYSDRRLYQGGSSSCCQEHPHCSGRLQGCV